MSRKELARSARV